MQVRGKPIKSVEKFCRWIKEGKPVCWNPDIGDSNRRTLFYDAEEFDSVDLPFVETVDEIRSGHWFEVVEK